MTSLWTRAGLTWRELGVRLWRQIYQDELLGRSAELAYFFLFSAFPLLVFLTTLLGYMAGASASLRFNLLWYLAKISPSPEITSLLTGTLEEITLARSGLKLYASLFAALWISSNGMIAVGRTLNIACGLKETRRWWKRRIISVMLTIMFAVLIISALTVIFYGGAIATLLAEHVGPFFAVAWHFFKWPLVLAFVVLSFEMVYNYAPNLGETPYRQWLTPGAVTGVSLFLLASFGLRLYLAYFHAYSTTYGSVGAVILLLTWFYMTGFAILMGGEVNSEIGNELSRLKALREGKETPQERRRRRRRLLRYLRS
ncbi:MAG: YihY/virulence factor BrkB family protein [Acidobacteriota bacterium]